jgi:hypothetical protein
MKVLYHFAMAIFHSIGGIAWYYLFSNKVVPLWLACILISFCCLAVIIRFADIWKEIHKPQP